jgi:hypothetical protein
MCRAPEPRESPSSWQAPGCERCAFDPRCVVVCAPSLLPVRAHASEPWWVLLADRILDRQTLRLVHNERLDQTQLPGLSPVRTCPAWALRAPMAWTRRHFSPPTSNTRRCWSPGSSTWTVTAHSMWSRAAPRTALPTGWPPAGRRGWRLPPPSLSTPYAAYARGLADGLPQAELVVDHPHVERLVNAALDDVRCRSRHPHASSRGASIRPGLNPTGRTSMPASADVRRPRLHDRRDGGRHPAERVMVTSG